MNIDIKRLYEFGFAGKRNIKINVNGKDKETEVFFQIKLQSYGIDFKKKLVLRLSCKNSNYISIKDISEDVLEKFLNDDNVYIDEICKKYIEETVDKVLEL